MRNTLEGGRRSPRRGDGCMFRARPRPRRDVGPVSSVAIGPMRPSPPSRRHPGHCSTIPDAVGARATRRRHACCCTPYGPPSAAPSSQRTGDDRTEDSYAATLEAAPGQTQGTPRRPARGKIRQDGRLLHGTVRHTITRS
jgi:hypothetical protein